MSNAPYGPNQDSGSPDDNLVLVMVDETDDDNREESSGDGDNGGDDNEDDGSSSSEGDEEEGTSEEFTDEDIQVSPFIQPPPSASVTKKVTAATNSNSQQNPTYKSATNEKCDKNTLIAEDENALSSVGATVEGGRSTNGQDERKRTRKSRNLKSIVDKKSDKKTKKQVWNRTLCMNHLVQNHCHVS